MTRHEDNDTTDSSGEDAGQQRLEAMLGNMRELGEQAGGMLQDLARLLQTESRLFAASLLRIVVIGVALGFLLSVAFALLGTALIMLLIVHAGLDPVLAVLLALFFIVLVMAGLMWWLRRLCGDLRFRHSRLALSEMVAQIKRDGGAS